jgi:glycosyltransferase involved in cell wall biosynthesis
VRRFDSSRGHQDCSKLRSRVNETEHAAISVVVPVFNGVGTLDELVSRIDTVLEGTEHEFVLVNDGSTDGTWQRIVELSRSNPRVRGLDLMRNYGQHNALLAGIRAANHPITVTLDHDLQNPPEEIPKLLAELEAGADVVYGAAEEPAFGLWRNLATRLTKFALRGVIGNRVASQVSAYRAFRTDLRGTFEEFRGPDVSIDVLLSWGTRSFAAVPVRHEPAPGGRTTYTFTRLATHALNVLTGFSTRPLRIASLVGVAFTLFGAAILVLVLVRYLTDSKGGVPGFPFLASIIAIFSGVQLLTLGVIGEYLARMHVRIMSRPAYAVREEVGSAER